jgi:hypothetical protein
VVRAGGRLGPMLYVFRDYFGAGPRLATSRRR